MNFFSIPGVSLAISLVICWALFAIACSLINEGFAQINAERGRFMRKYLFEQFQDDANQINWATLLYQQGNIDLLSRDSRKPSNDIAPGEFSKAIIMAVANSNLVQIKLQALEIRANYEFPDADILQVYKKLDSYNTVLYKKFKAGVLLLNYSEQISLFASSLTQAETAAGDAKGVVDEHKTLAFLSTSLENWFIEFQERLTLWYKKRTRRKLFWVGLLLAVFINVDSLQLFKLFNHDDAQRQAIIDYYIKDSSDTKNPGKIDSLLKQNKIPVGFQYSIFKNPHQNIGALFLKLIGIIISGLAASMGAPFWFDVLKKAYTIKIP